jgi:cell division protein FtsL
MTNMPPTQVQDMIDHAARQSDRWLMILLLVVILVGGVWLIRMVFGAMARQITAIVDELKADRKNAEKDRDRLETVIEENTAALTAHVECSRNQSSALQQLQIAVQRCARQ